MIKHLRLNKNLWFAATGLVLFAAVNGLIDNSIYDNLMPKIFVAAQIPQDFLTILVCGLMLFLIIRTKENSYKEPIIIVGILGAFAYLYGIFSIERIYNWLYLAYLAILSTSLFTIIYSLVSFRSETVAKINVPKGVRITNAVFSLLVGGLFSMLWITALIPLMKTGNQIDNLFSIYLIDLVFIMPAFAITAIMTFLKKPMGYILTPAMFIMGIFVIFPLALGELMKPSIGMVTDYNGMAMSLILSVLFLVGSIAQLITMSSGSGREL